MASTRLVPLLAAVLLSTVAVAAPQMPDGARAAPARSDIIVEGQAIRVLASDFVDRVLPTSRGGQFGRFEDPICPEVIGLDANFEQEIGGRMAAVGRALQIDVETRPCTPNLVLIIVPDKAAAIAAFRATHPEYFGFAPPSQIDAMAGSSRPYAAWQLSELFTSDGMRLGISDTRPSGGSGAKAGRRRFLDLNAVRLRTTEPPSRLRANVKPHIQSAVVLVESGALANLDTRQLADFALMQAMLPADLRNGEMPRASILSVFANLPVTNDAPQSLTYADVAFLKSLRSVRSDTYASIQKNEIRQQMIDELHKVHGTRN